MLVNVGWQFVVEVLLVELLCACLEDGFDGVVSSGCGCAYTHL